MPGPCLTREREGKSSRQEGKKGQGPGCQHELAPVRFDREGPCPQFFILLFSQGQA